MNTAKKIPQSKTMFRLLYGRGRDQAEAPVPAVVATRNEDGKVCRAWSVRQCTPQAEAWLDQLKLRVKRDTSWKRSAHYSRLGGNALEELKNQSVYRVDVSASGGLRAESLFSREQAAIVLTNRSGRPIGYTAYTLVWDVSRDKHGHHELEVVVDEVWLEPGRREEGLGSFMAETLVSVVWTHLSNIERRLVYSIEPTYFDVIYGGDVYSESGSKFLSLCADEHEVWHHLEDGAERPGLLMEKSVCSDARW